MEGTERGVMSRGKPIAHGTWQGYKQEIYRNTVTCDKCREAWRNYCRERKVAREGRSSQ